MPALKFDDVSLGISHVDKRQPAGVGNLDGDNLADIVTAKGEDLSALGIDIWHFERKVREARTVQRGRQGWLVFLVGEDLDSWAVLTVAGQTQVATSDTCVGHRGERVDVKSVMVALGAHRHAFEDRAVEIGEPLPIISNQIGMGIADGRCGV